MSRTVGAGAPDKSTSLREALEEAILNFESVIESAESAVRRLRRRLEEIDEAQESLVRTLDPDNSKG